MTRIVVAAGGGGDAVAAVMVGAALGGGRGLVVVLAHAWDRLIVDPLPGPRGPADFTGLRRLTPSVYAVPPDAQPIARRARRCCGRPVSRVTPSTSVVPGQCSEKCELRAPSCAKISVWHRTPDNVNVSAAGRRIGLLGRPT